MVVQRIDLATHHTLFMVWGLSSAGRASVLQAEDQEFDSPRLHSITSTGVILNFALLSLHIWMAPMIDASGTPGAKLTVQVAAHTYLKVRVRDPATDIATCSRSHAYPTILAWAEQDF